MLAYFRQICHDCVYAPVLHVLNICLQSYKNIIFGLKTVCAILLNRNKPSNALAKRTRMLTQVNGSFKACLHWRFWRRFLLRFQARFRGDFKSPV